MPFCTDCGNIIREPGIRCSCGGEAAQGIASGFGKSSSNTNESGKLPSKTQPISPSPTVRIPGPSPLMKPAVPSSTASTTKEAKPNVPPKPQPAPISPIRSVETASTTLESESVNCTLCLEPLNLTKAKKSWEQPNIFYCQGCWQVRPRSSGVTAENPPSMSALKSTLNYQLGPIQKELPPTNSNPSSQNLQPPSASTIKPEIDTSSLLDSHISRQPAPASNHCLKPNKNKIELPSTDLSYCSKCKCIKPKKYFVLPDDQIICESCWICSKCGKNLSSGTYVVENGAIVHPECVTKIICARCNTPIEDSFIERNQQKIHLNCFKCADCKKPLAGVPFGMLIGKEFCQTCLKAHDE